MDIVDARSRAIAVCLDGPDPVSRRSPKMPLLFRLVDRYARLSITFRRTRVRIVLRLEGEHDTKLPRCMLLISCQFDGFEWELGYFPSKIWAFGSLAERVFPKALEAHRTKKQCTCCAAHKNK